MSSIAATDLQPGDILVYNSDGWLSWAIRVADNAEVSHAGVYLGSGMIAEALAVGDAGLNTHTVAESFAGSNWIDARRLHVFQSAEPILSVAQSYLDQNNRYGYGQILLLAGLCLTRKLDFGNPIIRRMADRAFRAAADFVHRMQDSDKEPMICSEFAFRTYDEALPDPDDPYSLEIIPQVGKLRRRFSRFSHAKGVAGDAGETDPPTIHPDSLAKELEEEPELLEQPPRSFAKGLDNSDDLIDQTEEAIKEWLDPQGVRVKGVGAGPFDDVDMADLKQSAAEFSNALIDASSPPEIDGKPIVYGAMSRADKLKAILADFVTPGDLARSPSLVTVGRLKP